MTAGDHDPVRCYTPEEERQLTEQLEALTKSVHAGEFRGRLLNLDLLRNLHEALFQGVRGHAGRNRRRGFGSEHLIFGPHRSVHRDVVERDLLGIFERVQRNCRAICDANADDYEFAAISLAVRTHADVIRVHPFEDGNGRTGRLCAGHLLVQLGLQPVPIEAVKQEYIGALNHYYISGEIEPLVHLYITLYPAGR